MYASPDMARGYEFEQFVKEILERAPDIELMTTPSPYGPDSGFDVNIQTPWQGWVAPASARLTVLICLLRVGCS